MKKVLIICYYWPPSGGSGVQRWVKFVKYLQEFGWQPVVFVPSGAEYPFYDESLLKDIPGNVEILRQPIIEPYSLFKKLMGSDSQKPVKHGIISSQMNKSLGGRLSLWVRSNIFIPDARMLWIRPSVRFLCKYLKQNPVDVVVSTGPPHSCHIIGLKVSQAINLPWIADFRDPWTNIYYFAHLNLTKTALKKHISLENQVLEKANKTIVVSHAMKQVLGTHTSKPIDFEVIQNGFDEQDYDFRPVEKYKKFTISAIGLWTAHQNPSNFFEALSQLCQNEAGFAQNLSLRLIGSIAPEIFQQFQHYGLQDYIEHTDYIAHDQVVKIQKKVHALLIIIPLSTSVDNSFILSGKLFECLAARRPVLVLGAAPHFEICQVIADTQSGACFDYCDNPKNLKSYILGLYNEYKSGASEQDLPISQSISEYGRRRLTMRLAELLNQLTNKAQ